VKRLAKLANFGGRIWVISLSSTINHIKSSSVM
jgi:hypothetical protein